MVSDGEFDRWLPEQARSQSAMFWTPVGVAMRIARWLEHRGVSRVLDVGSGTGKFCVVGGLASEMTFVGIEQRLSLVEVARGMAKRFDVESRVHFAHGDLSSLQALPFDAVYFYNPFEENLLHAGLWIDRSMELGRAAFTRSVQRAEALLDRMPVHSYLVTYQGLGGRIPGGYVLEKERALGRNMLRLFRKQRAMPSDGFWIELDDRTIYFRTRTDAACDSMERSDPSSCSREHAAPQRHLRLVPRSPNR